MDAALQQACTSGRAADNSGNQARLEAVSAAEHPQCLLCSAANPFGMKLKFTVQKDGSVLTAFPCREILQSYRETLHGGIISAVLDAAMTNAMFSIGVVAVTAELTVRFLAPVILNQGAVVRAWIDKATSHRLYYVRSELEQDRKVMARASAKFVVRSVSTDYSDTLQGRYGQRGKRQQARCADGLRPGALLQRGRDRPFHEPAKCGRACRDRHGRVWHWKTSTSRFWPWRRPLSGCAACRASATRPTERP